MRSNTSISSSVLTILADILALYQCSKFIKSLSICPKMYSTGTNFSFSNNPHIGHFFSVKDISTIGRATQGYRVMRLKDGDKVAMVARVV